MHRWVLFFGEWTGWHPCLADEGSYSPGDGAAATTSYRAWEWLWFRFVLKEHVGCH